METVKAYGKINLGLEIHGKRPDGFHEINSLFHTIDLYDELTFHKSDHSIELKCNHPFLPTGTGNLVYRAADLIFKYTGIRKGIVITLQKNIPVGAGLGGGSSDAAATLKTINAIFKTGLSDAELMKLAIQLGADVPFFIRGGCALVSGIGEILESAPRSLDLNLLFVFPEFSVSTAWVYKNYIAPLTKSKNRVIKVWSRILEDDWDSMDWSQLLAGLTNDLETVTLRRYPDLRSIKETLIEQGAILAMMSGSGSGIFGIFHTPERCVEVQTLLQANNYETFIGKTI